MAGEKFTVIFFALLCYGSQVKSVSVLEELPIRDANYDSYDSANRLSPMAFLESKFFKQQSEMMELIGRIVQNQEQLEESLSERLEFQEAMFAQRLTSVEEAIRRRIDSMESDRDQITEAFYDALNQHRSSVDSGIENLNDQIVLNRQQLKLSITKVFSMLQETLGRMSSMDQKLSLMTKREGLIQNHDGSGDEDAGALDIGNGMDTENNTMENVIDAEQNNSVQNFVVEITEDIDKFEESSSKDDLDILYEIISNVETSYETEHVYRSCSEVPLNQPGIHWLQNFKAEKAYQGYCEQDQHQGGWLVIQHRFNGSVDFYRGWDDYKAGFGQLDGEFWLGLDKLYRLTLAARHILMVELEAYNGDYRYAQYDDFRIGDESENYVLKELGSYSGTAGDSLSLHKGMSFTTKDRDNDIKSWNNCALEYSGAWWYEKCHHSNLNGPYVNDITPASNCWLTMTDHTYRGLKMTRMMIKEAPYEFFELE